MFFKNKFKLGIFYFIPLINSYLHAARDGHAFAEDLVEWTRAHCVPEGGLGEEAGRVVGILDIGHRYCRIGDAVINYSVHGYGNAVLGQHLEWENNLASIWG